MERAVILVGHGAPARGFPSEVVARWKMLEGRRRAAGGPPSEEEIALDRQIREFPRTAENDPYAAGLEALGAALAPLLGGAVLLLAYNEFCAPTLEEAVEHAVRGGARRVEVVPSMLTPGGVHAEVEIPEAIERARAAHPGVEIRYAWPFDLAAVARMLADHVRR
jgi:sirohydrochlorin cobaltochelatase